MNPKQRTNDLVVQDFENEVLIYDLNSNKAFCLNQTSAMVWQFADGNREVAEIADLMSKRLRILVTEELVWLALDQLKRDGLLENKDFEIDFRGLNRRQVIKKVGLASMVMLPLISSIIAPSAVNAASGLGLGGSCTANLQCASNTCSTCNDFLNLMLCCASASSPSTSCLVGFYIGDGCFPQTNCTPSLCCTGMVLFEVNNHCSSPGQGRCLCDDP